MSTFQIALSVCLLTFFLITGCNDLTQSNNSSLNSQIVKEVQDADAQMAEKQNAQPAMSNDVSTTVEIIKQENRDAEADQQSSAADQQAVDKLAQADKQEGKNSADAAVQNVVDSAAEQTTSSTSK